MIYLIVIIIIFLIKRKLDLASTEGIVVAISVGQRVKLKPSKKPYLANRDIVVISV